MDPVAAKAASATLSRHWREGTRLGALPEALRPGSRADGYAIQSCLETTSERPLFGWKIAATSAAGQQVLNVDGPLAGRLLAEMVYADGDTLPLRSNGMRVAEAEFAFRIAADLQPRETPYTVNEVMDAVSDLHLAIEIPDTRYNDCTNVGSEALIADNACGHQFVLGPKAPRAWRDMDLAAHPVIGTVADRSRREGVGGNVLGDPRIALAWLVNELSRNGVTLAENQIVTTGTCFPPPPIEPGDTVTIDYGSLGAISATFE